jgi:hypothetical protein
VKRLADKAALYWWGARESLRLGRPEVALGFFGGLGDDLLCTAPIDEWLRRGARNIWFFTRHPALYPRYDSRVHLLPEDGRYVRLATLLGRPVKFLSYARYDLTTDQDTVPPRHIIAEMCRLAGLTGPVRIRPYLELVPAERRRFAELDACIAIQAGGLDASVPMKNKQWPVERMADVARQLAAGHRVVQIGSRSDPPLPGAVDLRGGTTPRETAAVLVGARLFVGLVGFPMHLARAVGCPAVIVYGGRETPELTGYACNYNISTVPPCSPCWLRNRCDHDHVCMTAISAEQVLVGVRTLLARPRGGLQETEVVL